MKKLIAIIALSVALAGCQTFNPFTSVKNPANQTNLYQTELVFDASLKTFNELKALCASRVLPTSCRAYVKQGQSYIVRASAADVAARNFVDNNPNLDATNVVQAFTGIVSDFKSTVDQLSATRN